MSSDIRPSLCYHPESDSLFYSWEFQTDGLVEDVTGVPEMEAEAIKRGIQVPEKRPATRMELVKALADLARDSFEKALDDATRTCLNCEHFVDDRQVCGLNNKMPPPKIAVSGCECYEGKIPF